MKRFVCRDIIPGCTHVVTGVSDQSVLDQVITHVAVDHGLVKPPLALVELVVATTQTLADVRPRGHLRLVDSAPTEQLAMAEPEPPPEPDCPPPGVLTLATDRFARPRVHRWTDMPAPPAADPHERYRHECLLYRGKDEFLAEIVPFIQDGLERGQQVMVAVAEPRLQALRDALGDDASFVVFADMAELGRNPALIIPAWREFAAAANGSPIRGVGEPIWAGRSDAEIVECQFHEALLNVAVAPDMPLWLLCPYDIGELPDALVVEALRSHPLIAEANSDPTDATGRDDDGNRLYGGQPHAMSLFAADLPEPTAPTTAVPFDDERHAEAATRILRFAAQAGIPAQRSAKLVTAIDEIATVGIRETGHVRIRLWRADGAVVCEVGDRSMVNDPLIGRTSTLTPKSRERGIRLANELCDLVQVRSNSTGTFVRMHSLL